jgi:hypothetical protein
MMLGMWIRLVCEAVDEFIRTEEAFFAEHAKTACSLEETSENASIIIAKCKRVVELEKLAKEMLPPTELELQAVASDISALEETIADLSLRPQSIIHANLKAACKKETRLRKALERSRLLGVIASQDMHSELKELATYLDKTKTRVEDLALTVFKINDSTHYRFRLPIFPDNHVATIAENADALKLKMLSNIEEHKEKLTRYHQNNTRIHALILTISRLKPTAEPSLQHTFKLCQAYNYAAEIIRAAKPTNPQAFL